MQTTFKLGDKVAYSVKFLKSTGTYTGDLPRARGTITNIHMLGGDTQLCTVDWENPNIPDKVIGPNLILKDRIGIDSALNT
jgi:hypothetical protein